MGPKGKLWFDDDPGHDLEDRIRRACGAYRRAFGEEPNVVHVNIHEASVYEPGPGSDEVLPPEERISANITMEQRIRVVFSRSCLPNHYFAFREEDERGTEREISGDCKEVG